MVLLCAAHYPESCEAPEVPGTGPAAPLSTPSSSALSVSPEGSSFTIPVMHEIEYIILPDHRRNMDTSLMLWPSFTKGKQISLSLLVDNAIMNVCKGGF